MNRLGQEILNLIDSEGPIPLDRYMSLCLAHPTLGYYTTRDPLGSRGDFITSPEISQIFGELIGLWLAEMWLALGSPGVVRVVEAGPGRGTLMADILRAARALPAFAHTLDVHLIETSPELTSVQRLTLDGHRVTWHRSLETLPNGPLLFVANEFFDALPVRQFECRRGQWFERMIGRAGSGLAMGLSPDPIRPGTFPAGHDQAPDGAVLELGQEREAFAKDLAAKLRAESGAALIIDYGPPVWGYGDTFQAMRGHGYVDPLAEPGEADLTSHVDFDALARVANALGTEVYGPLDQGRFLNEIGLSIRVERLSAGKSAKERADIASRAHRLVSANQMGRLFQVLAITSPDLPVPPPFTHRRPQ